MRPFLALFAVLALSASVLAGCSAAVPEKSAAPPSGGSSALASGNTGPVNVCAAVPQSAASSAAGIEFTSAQENDIAKGVFGCAYGTDSLNWTVAVYQSPNTEKLDDLLADLGGSSNSKPASGIGDKAYVSPVAVAAQFGNRLIEVGSANNDASNEAGYEALAKAAIAALKQ